MNYDFISAEKLRPFWFWYVGITVAFCTLIISIFLKASDTSTLFGLNQELLKPVFFLSLLVMNSSKRKTEDEGTTLIRLQINRFGYNFIVGVLALFFLAEASGRNPLNNDLLFSWLISIVTTQVLIYEAIKSSKIMDFFENHQIIFQLLAILLMVFLIQIHQWLW